MLKKGIYDAYELLVAPFEKKDQDVPDLIREGSQYFIQKGRPQALAECTLAVCTLDDDAAFMRGPEIRINLSQSSVPDRNGMPEIVPYTLVHELTHAERNYWDGHNPIEECIADKAKLEAASSICQECTQNIQKFHGKIFSHQPTTTIQGLEIPTKSGYFSGPACEPYVQASKGKLCWAHYFAKNRNH